MKLSVKMKCAGVTEGEQNHSYRFHNLDLVNENLPPHVFVQVDTLTKVFRENLPIPGRIYTLTIEEK